MGDSGSFRDMLLMFIVIALFFIAIVLVGIGEDIEDQLRRIADVHAPQPAIEQIESITRQKDEP